jgi:tetratricopeptide (TPR) repeat protein
MLSEAHTRLHWAYLVTGDYDRATAHADAAAQLAEQSHNVDAQAISRFMLGVLHWEQGDLEQARAVMEEDIAIAASVRSLTPLIGTRADLALLYGEMGEVAHGRELAALARATAEEMLPILREWPHAVQVILALWDDDLEAAREYAATLEEYRTVQRRFGYMPFMWIRVGLAHGELALAQQEYGHAVELMDALYADLTASDIWYLRADVLYIKARALQAQGSTCAQAASETLIQTRSVAERVGSRRVLDQIP